MIKRNPCWLQSSCNISTVSFKNYEVAINFIHNSKSGKGLTSRAFFFPYINICSTVKSQMGYSPPKKSQMPSLYLPTHTFL